MSRRPHAPSAQHRWLLWTNLALTLPALASLAAGIRNALRGSKDLQWSAPHLALQHIDPYRQFLLHDPGHLILLAQIPNYLHILYLALLPLGALPFPRALQIWVVCNCLFTLLILLVLRRIYALDPSRTILLALLLLCSTPYRISLGNGQISLLELLAFTLVFLPISVPSRGLALGLSYAKYSFSPPVFFFLLFRRAFRMLAYSLVLPLLGLLAIWILVHGNLLHLAIEPFQVGRNGVDIGPADLMSQIRMLVENHLLALPWLRLMSPIGLLACALYAAWLARQHDTTSPRAAAALSTASLLFLTHLTYDFVFLVIPLAASLRPPFNRTRLAVLTLIALFWYGIKFVPPTQLRSLAVVEFFLTFASVAAILVAVSSSSFAAPSTLPPFDPQPPR